MNEQQYYNPIIQAMVSSAQLAQNKAEAGEKAKQFVADNKIRQQLADQALQDIQQRGDYQKATLANEHERVKNLHDEFILHSTEAARQAIAQGVKPQDAGNGQITVPGIPGQFPAGSLPGPEDEAKMLQQRNAAITAGQEEGKVPAQKELALYNHSLQMQEDSQKLDNQLQLQAANGANQEKLANIHGGYQTAVANMEGQYRLKGINLMHSLGMGEGVGDNDTALSIVNNKIDGILNGNTAYSSLSKDEKRAVDAVAAQRKIQLPTDQKSYAKNLNNLGNLDNLFNDMEDAAKKYSQNSPGGGFIAKNRPTLGGILPQTDLQAKMDDLKSKVGAAATTFEETGRKNEAVIVRSLNGLMNPSSTMQQNLANIEAKRKDLNNTLVPQILTGIPDMEKNRILGNRLITNFGGYGQTQPKAAPPAAPVAGSPPQSTPATISYVRDPQTGQLVSQ